MDEHRIITTEEISARHIRKYQCRNPIQEFFLRRFFAKVHSWLDLIKPKLVLDFGCGECFFWKRLAELGPLPKVVGIDLREDALAMAHSEFPEFTLLQVDLLECNTSELEADLVIASEVLEHLPDPKPYLEKLCSLAKRRVLLTVPHEPFFRMCNLLRGRDVSRLGNHPEHVQQWTRIAFVDFVSDFLRIEKIVTSFPFILLLGIPKQQKGRQRYPIGMSDSIRQTRFQRVSTARMAK